MNFMEYGAAGRETVILLHGGGLSWWNYREEAELLQNEFRVILPILDGHAGSDRPFTTIEDCADGLLALIDERCGGSVALIGGLSLGGQVLLELLSRRAEVCRHAIAESAMLLPSPLMRALIGPAFGSSYGLIKNRSFAVLQARSLRIPPTLFEDYYRDSCAIAKKDMIAFLKANCSYALKDDVKRSGARLHICVGEKETRGILRSAELLHERLPGSALTVMPGLYHGEYSLCHAQDYADAVRAVLREGEQL